MDFLGVPTGVGSAALEDLYLRQTPILFNRRMEAGFDNALKQQWHLNPCAIAVSYHSAAPGPILFKLSVDGDGDPQLDFCQGIVLYNSRGSGESDHGSSE